MKNYILAKEFYWVKLEATMPLDYPGVFAHKKYAVFFQQRIFSKFCIITLYKCPTLSSGLRPKRRNILS